MQGAQVPLSYAPVAMKALELAPWVPSGSHVVKGPPPKSLSTSYLAAQQRSPVPMTSAPHAYSATPFPVNPFFMAPQSKRGAPVRPPVVSRRAQHAEVQATNAWSPGYMNPWQFYPPPLPQGYPAFQNPVSQNLPKNPTIKTPRQPRLANPGGTMAQGPPGNHWSAWDPAQAFMWNAQAPMAVPVAIPNPLQRRASWAGKEVPFGTQLAFQQPHHLGSTAGFPGVSNKIGRASGAPAQDRATQRMQAVYERQLERLKSLEESILDQMVAREQSNAIGCGRSVVSGPWRDDRRPQQRAEFRVY
jgi:hypothetical protein